MQLHRALLSGTPVEYSFSEHFVAADEEHHPISSLQ